MLPAAHRDLLDAARGQQGRHRGDRPGAAALFACSVPAPLALRSRSARRRQGPDLNDARMNGLQVIVPTLRRAWNIVSSLPRLWDQIRRFWAQQEDCLFLNVYTKQVGTAVARRCSTTAGGRGRRGLTLAWLRSARRGTTPRTTTTTSPRPSLAPWWSSSTAAPSTPVPPTATSTARTSFCGRTWCSSPCSTAWAHWVSPRAARGHTELRLRCLSAAS